MILHSWQAQFRIKSGILGLTVEIPLWPPCFTTFLGPVLGVMMKQVCWHSRRSEAHRGLPEARPWMQNVLWRSLYAAMFLVSF